MKTVLYFAFLLAAASAQKTPEDQYTSICPSGPKDAEVDGHQVTYVCDSYPTKSGVTAVAGISDPEDCARQCLSLGGNGAAWDYSQTKCYIATDHTGGLAPEPGILFMSFSSKECAECRQELIEQQYMNQQLTKELEECQAKLPPKVVTCDEDDNQVVQVGSRKYQIFCGKIAHTGSNDQTLQGISSLDECIKKCNSNSAWCKRAIWNDSSNICYLRKLGDAGETKSANSIYHSAYLIG
ncbi:hypothetical protein DTO271G3_5540 [Paecilomyces variotii]|nr:hypothetical protein DTO271G3_5540 [Paecilomyces variotii]